MQNKKLLTMLLAAMLVVACAFGMLIVGVQAEERTAVTWTVGSEVESVADALADATAVEWTASDALIIDMNGESEEVAIDENGILFGLSTIFDASGARLPITIQNGTLTLPEGYEGDVVCANSYTFKSLTFPVADYAVNFYAGSGEVVFDAAVLLSGEEFLAHFAADNSTAYAFAGWDAPEAELIETSLTFANVSLASPTSDEIGAAVGNIHAVYGAEDFADENVTGVSAANISATLIVTDSILGDVYIRPATALSPVAKVSYVQNDSSEDNSATTVGSVRGIGSITADNANANMGKCDVFITINGGTVKEGSRFFRGASYDGNFTVVINDGLFKDPVETSYGSYLEYGGITGQAIVTVNGGVFEGTFFGSTVTSRGSDNKVPDILNVNGGTFLTGIQANRVSANAIVNINGGVINAYCGSYSSATAGGVFPASIVTNMNAGVVHSYFGTGGPSDGVGYDITTVENNMNGGAVLKEFYGTGAGAREAIASVTNNFKGTIFGVGDNETYETIEGETTTERDSFKVFCTKGSCKVAYVENNLTDALGTSYYFGTGGSTDGRVVNNVGGTSEATILLPRFYGSYGNVASVENNLSYVSGFAGESHVTRSGYTISGDIVNNFDHVTSKFGLYLVEGTVLGNVENNVTNCSFNATKNTSRYVRFINANVGGNAETTLIDCTINTNQLFTFLDSGKTISGDYTVTLENTAIKSTAVNENTTLLGGYIGNAGTVVGTMKTIVKGTTSFAAAYYGSYGPAGKVVNQIEGGTFSAAFYGNGAAVTGLYKTEGEEQVLVEAASVNNLITGGKFGTIYPSSGALTADVYTSVEGPVTVPRDELKTRKDELIYIGGFGGNNGAITGDLIYEVKNVNLGGGNLTAGNVSGLFKMELENAYVRNNTNFSDCSTTKLAIMQVVEIYRNVYVDYAGSSARAFQFANKDASFDGDATLVLENFRIDSSGKSGNLKPMNVVGGEMNVFLYGDTFLSGDAGISMGRQDPDTKAYIGARPIFDEDYNIIGVEPAETTVKADGETAAFRLRTAPSKASFYPNAHTGYIYPTTFDGISFASDPVTYVNDRVVLCGDVVLKNGASLVADSVSESVGRVAISTDAWVADQTYVTMRGEGEISKVAGKNALGTAGYAKKVDNTLVGAAFADPSASMSIDGRVIVNLWLPKADVDAYFANGMLNAKGEAAFDVTATLTSDAEYVLKNVSLKESDLAALASGDYYKIRLDAVAANDFDKKITFKGSAFSAEASILEICESGLAGSYTEAELNLFKALYNYGAAVCIDPETDDYYALKDLGADFIVDDKDNIRVGAFATDKVAFSQINLLMGDAIGVRFTGVLVDPAAQITLEINGEAVEGYYVQKSGSKATVEFYVGSDDYSEELQIAVYTDGVVAAKAILSIEGYSEQVMGMGNAELALAQLVQACLNM